MSNQIEYRHIRYFLAVAETLHFRKAAEKLYISQPGLTRQIKNMEDDLGVKLFDRHNRKVELTKTGEYLRKELTRNLNELTEILDFAKLVNNGVEGNLNFGYVGSAMKKIIPQLLLRLKEEYENVVFNLKEMNNQQQIEQLLSNEIDVGFVRLDRVPAGLGIYEVLKEPFCLVLPIEHPLNSDNFKSLIQLEKVPFIMFDSSDSSSYYEKVMQLFDDSGFSPIVSHSTIHAASIYSLVENGLGISIVPASLTLTDNKKVKFIALDKMTQRTSLSVIWNKNNKNPSLQHLLKFIEEI
ncbi:LysR substrate-binding domain-containing protein [Polaribacter sp. L3A8]|uniref:LysR substrate-binding domain-containing protein n=1 Tax=Polaribacter sp. L3A8 TaxID=2686361 RepID=UPI00131E4900|nr:LysR substrate-binding domain-containing protein [Polaribacter sp. L3A8]